MDNLAEPVHDEDARDGFVVTPKPEKNKHIPLDLSMKSKIMFKLRDTTNFKRIRSLDWARACAQMTPETDAQGFLAKIRLKLQLYQNVV